jgi:hypothetical protein
VHAVAGITDEGVRVRARDCAPGAPASTGSTPVREDIKQHIESLRWLARADRQLRQVRELLSRHPDSSR